MYNVRLIKSHADAEIYAVVKANAYGHGMPIATYLQPYVDGFCVATSEEAKRLLELAIYKPILILGEVGDCNRILPYKNVVYTVGSMKEVKMFKKLKGASFYIKLNTGMNRLGCDSIEMQKIINYVRHNSLDCKGIYTHFFQSDNKDAVRLQYSEFESGISRIRDFVGARHCCASNVLDMEACYHNDIARVGLALYGYGSSDVGLRSAMSVCAPIVKIRNLKKGDYVSYGNYRVARDCRIAVLRIGYGDGYRRLGDKKRFVSINGKRCPLIGQVCMDMCMADISGISAKVGDFAYVLGKGITAEELAEEYGTIVYEVLTSFNDRVERVYAG